MYIINDIPIISPQTWGFSNLSNLLRTDQAVFIYMNNMSLHFNEYEEKSEISFFWFKI